MRSTQAWLVMMAAVLVSGCWFPGNPTGISSNHAPTPECPDSFPAGKPCKREKMDFCTAKSTTYECYDDVWHAKY